MSEFLESVLVFGLRVFLVCVEVEQVSEFLLSEFLSALMGLTSRKSPRISYIWGKMAYDSHQNSNRVLIDFAIPRNKIMPFQKGLACRDVIPHLLCFIFKFIKPVFHNISNTNNPYKFIIFNNGDVACAAGCHFTS